MSALDTLQAFLVRHAEFRDERKSVLWADIADAAKRTESEMIELEAVMSKKRDWLDTHRDDPRYEKRRAKFFDTEVRLHAEYGESLERYEKALTGGAVNPVRQSAFDLLAERLKAGA